MMEERAEWIPKTSLGQAVKQGKVSSLEEIFEGGLKVKEPEIVQTLLPGLKNILVGVRMVQKQTDAGELTRFSAVVAVGDSSGWFGVGHGKAMQTKAAIDKATRNAILNIIPVQLGCGSWECRCGQPHSTPAKLYGKAGSVKIQIIPGPRGLGLVAGTSIKELLGLAGLKDAWTKTSGSTSTEISMALAIYNALGKVTNVRMTNK